MNGYKFVAMSFPVRITYRGLEPSETLNRQIQEEAAKLEKFYDGIVSCRVLVERHDGHHHTAPLNLRLNIVVPGADLAVVGEPSLTSVHDTFRRARRRVQEYARRRSLPQA